MTTAHDASPPNAAALRAQAFAVLAQGDTLGARALQAQVVTLEPLWADAYVDLAATELELDRPESARTHARRALALEPLHDTGRYALACAHERSGDKPRAIALMRQLAGDAQLQARNTDLALAAHQLLMQWTDGNAAEACLQIVDPTTLEIRQRFDILVKYLYALTRLGQQPAWATVDVGALYQRHIHLRTGGVEPGDQKRKSCVHDFVTQFDALIDNMAQHGFNPAHPVPLSSSNGLPRGGAHRLAAAMAVRCHAAVVTQKEDGWSWDDVWFQRHGFTLDERNTLLRAWADIKREQAVVVVLWSPVESVWGDIEAAIDAEIPLVSRRTIELPRAGFNELVHDLYSFDWGPRSGANIVRKTALLASHAPRLRVLFAERPAHLPPDSARELKQRLRQRFAALAPVEDFTTLHLSESAAEAAHGLAIFASSNNLRWLAQRQPLRPALMEHLEALRTIAKKNGFSADDCCIVGGSVLDALGLRCADDLDVTLRTHVRAAHFDDGVTPLGTSLDIVSRGYARSFTAAPPMDDDQLINRPDCHFLVRGIRFADPRIVLTRKQHQRRDKDLRDIAILGDWFERIPLENAHGSPHPWPKA